MARGRVLSLTDLDQHDGLIVGSRREDLALTGWDAGTAGNQFGHDAASGFNTQGQWVNIHENDLLGTLGARQDATLNGCSKSDGLIGVDVLASLLASKEVFQHRHNLGDTGGTPDQDDIVNLVLLDFTVFQDLFDRFQGLLEEIHVQFFEFGPSQRFGEILSLVETFDFDASGHLRGQSTLGLFDLTFEFTHGLEILGDVDVVLLVVLFGEVSDDPLIKVLTSQMGVPSGCQDLENTVVDRQEGDIKGSSSKVVDDDLTFITGLVQSVSDGGRGGLVDYAEYVQTSDDAGIFGCLSLVIVEVGWDRNDGVDDLLAKITLGDIPHLSQNHGGDFFRGEGSILSAHLDGDHGFVVLVGDTEWEMFNIGLDLLFGELAPN